MLETPTAAENMFRGLLESAPDPIVIVDERGLIRIVNRRDPGGRRDDASGARTRFEII